MTAPDTARPRDILTQAEAEPRAARVSHCRYVLSIDLRRGAEAYRGEATLDFDLRDVGDITVDFRGKLIELIEVNGSAVAADWDGYRILLPGAALLATNTVRLVYENEYDHSGDGFHQFRDPEDGEEYLYSNFEPFEAHRLFPCFDQPDIKGTYRLTVTAPSEWEVLSNSREVESSPAADGRVRHQFEETKPFSTYLFALVVGPYHAVRERHGDVDLGLFCRKSLVRYLDSDELFTITRQGLDFYADFFDFPYPFGKYDQVFVPEFNAGAMENVGCVTHNEYMVFRDPPTENQRRRRAETVLHEMAHMWFGDLVTMRWWNDLWLNESFATYMSYLTLTSATRFTSSWQDFNAAIKNWAYRQDQLVTTHPIAGQVRDTDETFLNFDGITYGKGASVLKQLVFAIGMDGFREGMRDYFRTHSYGNATLGQFLAALERGSGRELREWSRLWLETASLNTVSADWEGDGDRISRLVLRQSAPRDYPTLRPHRLEVGMLRAVDGRVDATSFPVEIDSAEVDVPAAIGAPAPGLVFPNYNDYDYAKVALDARSVGFARANLQRIEDPLLRQLLWSSLWNMTRDQQLKSTDFLALVREKLPLEPEVALLDPVLGQAQAALGRYVPDEWRERESRLLFAAFLEALRAATEPDARIIWARALIGCAITPEDLAFLGRLVDGTEEVAGLSVDQEMRWSVATKHVAYGLPRGMDRIETEFSRDPSDRGERARLRAEVSRPEPGVKTEAWDRVLGEGYGSLHLTAAAMSGFNWTHQHGILEPFADRFFEVVPSVFEREEKEFMTDFFGAMFPGYRVEGAILDRARQLLDRVGERQPVLARMLREANDDLERAIRCREFART